MVTCTSIDTMHETQHFAAAADLNLGLISSLWPHRPPVVFLVVAIIPSLGIFLGIFLEIPMTLGMHDQ
jgi:hypothetical protein